MADLYRYLVNRFERHFPMAILAFRMAIFPSILKFITFFFFNVMVRTAINSGMVNGLCASCMVTLVACKKS